MRLAYQPFVSWCLFYWLWAKGQNIPYSRVNCALGPSKSICYSGVCFHIFYWNSAGLSNVVRYNRVFVIAGFVIAGFHCISPSSQLFLGHFSLLPILFLPPLYIALKVCSLYSAPCCPHPVSTTCWLSQLSWLFRLMRNDLYELWLFWLLQPCIKRGFWWP